jgi:hypothetical protein
MRKSPGDVRSSRLDIEYACPTRLFAIDICFFCHTCALSSTSIDIITGRCTSFSCSKIKERKDLHTFTFVGCNIEGTQSIQQEEDGVKSKSSSNILDIVIYQNFILITKKH